MVLVFFLLSKLKTVILEFEKMEHEAKKGRRCGIESIQGVDAIRACRVLATADKASIFERETACTSRPA